MVLECFEGIWRCRRLGGIFLGLALVFSLGFAKLAEGAENLLSFREICLTGDAEVVRGLSAWPNWSARVLECSHSSEELESLRGELEQALRNAGYVFARVELLESSQSEGILALRVTCGQLGEFRVRQAGRYYTPRQVIRKLAGRSPGFNYAEFCRRLAELNSGDLRVDVTLRPIYRDGQLAVDAEVDYTDRLPVHGSLEILNSTAPEAKSSLQLRMGLQVQNLARCDDTLSMCYVTNGDLGEEVNAAYGAYRLPLGEKWIWTAFGSWSDSSYGEVVRGLDIQGRGYAYGVQLEREVYSDGRVSATAAVGWRVARVRNQLRLYSQTLELGSTTVSMPYLTFGYSEGGQDQWNGCNFGSLSLTGGRAGQWGASDEESFQAEGHGADGSFWQVRVDASRLQRLFVGDEHPGRWSLLMRLRGLYTSDASPNAVREYLGGYESVRGYQEAEVYGDLLLAGTLELRTRLLEKLSSETSSSWLPTGRLVGVLFTDFGWAGIHRDGNLPENGRQRHQELFSVGAGLRFGLSRWLQGAVDYALPLCRHATPNTPKHGRWHFALQFQF